MSGPSGTPGGRSQDSAGGSEYGDTDKRGHPAQTIHPEFEHRLECAVLEHEHGGSKTKNEEQARNVAIRILDEFEELLDRKDITVPSDDREGGADEARLYGSEYSGLEEDITAILLDTAGDTCDERGEPQSHT